MTKPRKGGGAGEGRPAPLLHLQEGGCQPPQTLCGQPLPGPLLGVYGEYLSRSRQADALPIWVRTIFPRVGGRGTPCDVCLQRVPPILADAAAPAAPNDVPLASGRGS